MCLIMVLASLPSTPKKITLSLPYSSASYLVLQPEYFVIRVYPYAYLHMHVFKPLSPE